MPQETASKLRALLDQCFDIFNVYGKRPEQVANIFKGFVVTLSGFDEQDIFKAFQKWMQEQSNFPTPADISKIIKAKYENPYDKKTHGAAYAEYKHQEKNKRPDWKVVPWYGKMWGEFTEYDKQQLAKHMGTFDSKEKARGYALYLKNHVGVPTDFTHQNIPA